MSLTRRKPGLTFLVAESLLGLVGKDLDWKSWTEWTDEQRTQAADWAAAVHLKASDNIVRKKRLIEPEHVKLLRPVDYEALERELGHRGAV